MIVEIQYYHLNIALSIGRCLGQYSEARTLKNRYQSVSKTLIMLCLWDSIFAIGEMTSTKIALSLRLITLGIRLGFTAKLIHAMRLTETLDLRLIQVAGLQLITAGVQTIDFGSTLAGKEPLGSQFIGPWEFLLRALLANV